MSYTALAIFMIVIAEKFSINHYTLDLNIGLLITVTAVDCGLDWNQTELPGRNNWLAISSGHNVSHYRCKRLDCRVLNDGSDDEAAIHDASSLLSSRSAVGSYINIPDDEVIPPRSPTAGTGHRAAMGIL
ncbi:hypothetical protein V1506DRAFT_549105 [Lipomyces tetrasporus]